VFHLCRSHSAKSHIFLSGHQLNNDDMSLFDSKEVVDEMTFFLQILRVLAFQVSTTAKMSTSRDVHQLILVQFLLKYFVRSINRLHEAIGIL